MDEIRKQPELIDIKELSARTNRSVSSLHRDVRKGRLQAFQPAGRGGKLMFSSDVLSLFPPAAGGSDSPSQRGPASQRLSGRRPTWMAAPKSKDDTKSEE
jgi:hypothetical protein